MVESHEEVQNIIYQAAKQLNKRPEDMNKYIAKLTTHCITTEKAFRGASNDDVSTMGVPQEIIAKAREILGQD